MKAASDGSAAMRAVWLLGVLALALFLGLAVFLAPLEPGVLHLQFAFTPRAFGQIIHVWQAEGLARFRAHFPADFVLALSYGAFGFLLAQRSGAFGAQAKWARWLLPLAAAFDGAENVLHLWLTAAPRLDVFWPYPLAATAASLKWTLLLAFALFFVIARLRMTKR